MSEKDAANDSSSHPEEEVIVVGQATRPSSSGPFSGSGIFRKSQLRDLARATRAESRAISQIREQKLMNDIAEYVLTYFISVTVVLFVLPLLSVCDIILFSLQNLLTKIKHSRPLPNKPQQT